MTKIILKIYVENIIIMLYNQKLFVTIKKRCSLHNHLENKKQGGNLL